MKRIAAPMVGGIVTSFLLELLMYPAVYAVWRQRALPQGSSEPTGKEIVTSRYFGSAQDEPESQLSVPLQRL